MYLLNGIEPKYDAAKIKLKKIQLWLIVNNIIQFTHIIFAILHYAMQRPLEMVIFCLFEWFFNFKSFGASAISFLQL